MVDPVLFTIHNAEEAFFMRYRITSITDNALSYLKEYISTLTYEQFLVALVVVTVFPYLIAAFGNIGEKGSTAQYLLLLLQATIFLNVFSHISLSLSYQTYFPGFGTALAINLPFSFYLLKVGRAGKWISKWSLISMFPLVFLLHGPILWGLVHISGVVTN